MLTKQVKTIKKCYLTMGDKTLELDYLGKGRFSEAWSNGSKAYIFTDTRKGDYSKEILADLTGHTKHLPDVERVGYLDNSDVVLFAMPKYKMLRAKDKKAWEQFRAFQQAVKGAWRDTITKHQGKPDKWITAYCGYDQGCKVADLLNAAGEVDLAQAVQYLADSSANYGSGYWMEAAKRNCGVDSSGDLVLMDTLYDPSTF